MVVFVEDNLLLQNVEINITLNSGLNLVVHSANWFYVPECHMNIWNLKHFIDKKKSPSPYAPDFSILIESDEFNKSFAIVTDSGVLTRNAQSFEYNGFYDFFGGN